ncbi:cytochrome P450 4V2-like [Uloborus diversus]|uniref:cytochrome P450 4V2-like n=1 Tax=Uloborus diversus TaxID=327109 RepID=UPI00240A35B7|nr:cytochrome P450 4V2-like [Uloborus diversus]
MVIDVLSCLWTSCGLALIIVILSAIIYLKGSRQSSLLPTVTGSQLLYYCIILRSAYKKRKDNIHPLCIILQSVCGLCLMFERYRICRIWLLSRPIVFFYKPETIEVVLSSTIITEKSTEYQFLHPWLGTGLLTSKGEKWKIRRKFLTPAFHFKVLEDFVPVFDEHSKVLTEKLSRLSCDNAWLDIVPLITMCTLDIICQTAMGVNINSQSGGCGDYVQAIHEIGELILYRILRPWLWSDRTFYWFPAGRKFRSNLQKVHGFTRQVIKEKKELSLKIRTEKRMCENNSPSAVKRRKAFLELLLEHHFVDQSFTEEDIREEVDTFMFEGHDTTASTICWTLYCLGLYPNAQVTVHKEIDDIFGSDTSRPITREDLTQMKYLECVIKEALRLYPAIPFISRELRKDIQVLGYKVPAGSACFIFPWMLHRDPVSFPDPERFDPDRFFPQNAVHRHPYAYVPFSAGPRNCIGQRFAIMEQKTVLANILRKFRVLSLDPRDKVNVIPDLIIRNVEPLRIRFLLRETDSEAEK